MCAICQSTIPSDRSTRLPTYNCLITNRSETSSEYFDFVCNLKRNSLQAANEIVKKRTRKHLLIGFVAQVTSGPLAPVSRLPRVLSK